MITKFKSKKKNQVWKTKFILQLNQVAMLTLFEFLLIRESNVLTDRFQSTTSLNLGSQDCFI